jgi:hypothetical protein
LLKSNRAIRHQQTAYVYEFPLYISKTRQIAYIHKFSLSIFPTFRHSDRSRPQLLTSHSRYPHLIHIRVHDLTHEFSAFRISPTDQIKEGWIAYQIVSAVQHISEAFGRFRVHEPFR